MSKCSVDGCDLGRYGQLKKCILHCEKEKMGGAQTAPFDAELEKYIEAQKNTSPICFSSVVFPKMDYKFNNYVELLSDLKHICFRNCFFNSFEFNIKTDSNAEIEFNHCYFEEKLKIRNIEEEGKDYTHHQDNKAKLKQLKIIDCTAKEGAYLRVGYLDIEHFELSNLRNPLNTELNIGDCHFKSFKLSNFRNLGKFKLYKINVLEVEKGKKKDKDTNGFFQIDNTSIGDTDFQSIDLTSFATVFLFDNIFSNVKYSNMQWKKDIEVGEYADKNSSNKDIECKEIAKKRDTYRVLKNIAQFNNDQPQALIFYTKEMENHKKLTSLNLEKGRNKSDIWVLRFNDWTNDFGLNWFRPIWQLFIVSVIAYTILLATLELPIPVLEHWAKWFVFINPTHGVKFIAGGCWGFLAYGIDFVFRIVEGLLIYQTIVAFRKFSRKL